MSARVHPRVINRIARELHERRRRIELILGEVPFLRRWEELEEADRAIGRLVVRELLRDGVIRGPR